MRRITLWSTMFLFASASCALLPGEDGELDDTELALADSASPSLQRTVVFIYGETKSGQDLFIRGGLDHAQALARLGRRCSSANMECALPIVHRNLQNPTTTPWKAGDGFLDWYGRESGQGSSGGRPAEGTPLDWSTNYWPPAWGAQKTVASDGYGGEPLNMFGAHYWMLDVDMDCSKGFSAGGASWFELKSFISNGPGWESDVHQPGAPYASNNHFGQCGKLNVFRRGEHRALILPIEVRNDPYLVGAGDVAYSNDGKVQTAKLLDALAPGAEAVFVAGDAVQGTTSSVAQKTAELEGWFDPTWGRFRDKIRPAVGNHDFTPADPFYDYFGAAAGPRYLGYYGFDVGSSWHAVVLNSNIPSQTQLDWLRGELEANADKHILAYWHHPRFSSGEHGNNDFMAPAWKLLVEHHAEVVMSGHDHHYERFAPQSSTGARDEAAGLRQFVLGTGGMTMRPFGLVKANSEVRSTGTWGVLKLVLHPSWYEWIFVPVAGQSFFDTGSSPCHDI